MDTFIARQPIFDRHKNVFAYEILFRLGLDNFYNYKDGDRASLEVISNSFNLIGMDALTGGKRAFINFTKNLIKSDIATILPKELIVIEILEDVAIDDKVIECCKDLKQLGYLIALDDFVYKPEFKELVKLADIIKVDFVNTRGKDRENIIKTLKRPGLKFLAEKVETQEEFQYAYNMGYAYFQGYFFSEPIILSTKDIPSYKWTYLSIFKDINEDEPDFERIESIIKADVSLSYKLLRFINSSAFGFRMEIHSSRHALALLGKKETIKWLSLIALRGVGKDKPVEVLLLSVIRAKFGELIGAEVGLKHFCSDIFLMGIFSMIDVLIGRPLEEVLEKLPISSSVKVALLGGDNYFRDIYNLIISYERGNWNGLNKYSDKLRLDQCKIFNIYSEALNWSNEFIKY